MVTMEEEAPAEGTVVKEKKMPERGIFKSLDVEQESPHECFNNVSNLMNKTIESKPNLRDTDVHKDVHCELRYLVQLLTHDDPSYISTSLSLLQGLMMKYPILSQCVYYHIVRLFTNKIGKSTIRMEARQAKLLGFGAIVRSGTLFGNEPLLMKIVEEIIMNRMAGDKDDVDIFFLVSCLEHDASVAIASEVILEHMKHELSVPVYEMKFSTLWLRVKLAQRMIETGVTLPLFLRETFLPDNVYAMGDMLLPNTPVVEPVHPALPTFMDALASYHHHWLLSKNKLNKSVAVRPNPAAVLFTCSIGKFIAERYNDEENLHNLSIAFKILEGLINCPHMDVSIYESISNWVIGGGGVDILRKWVKRSFISGYLKQTERLFELHPEGDMRSRLFVSVFKAAQHCHELMPLLSRNLETTDTAVLKKMTESLISKQWKKLTTNQAALLFRLVFSKPLVEASHSKWRADVMENLLRRAVNSPIEEEPNDPSEKKKKRQYDCYFDPKLVEDRDLFYRFLSHASKQKNALNSFEEYFLPLNQKMCELMQGEVMLSHLPQNVLNLWQQINEKYKVLSALDKDTFKYKKLFEMLFCLYSIELLRANENYESDILSDLLICFDRAAEESSSGGSSPQESDEEGGAPDWRAVMMDVLMSVAAKDEAWWTMVLKPAGKILGCEMTSEVLETVTDVLLREDVIRPDGYVSDEEENGDEEEEENGDEGDEEEVEEEDNESEDNESSEDEESEAEDEENEVEESEDDELKEGREKQVETLRSKLMSAMGSQLITPEEEEDAEGEESEEDTEVTAPISMSEDMDKVPLKMLREMDRKFAEIFKVYREKRKENTANKKDADTDEKELLKYRTRVLDFLEGVVESNPSAAILLSSVTLPLSQAAKVNRKSSAFYSKVISILKDVRKSKPNGLEGCTEEIMLDGISEIFSYVKVLPDCYQAAVIILKYSVKIYDAESNPVLDAFIDNVVGMLRNNVVEQNIIADTIAVEIPTLRHRLLKTIIDGAFMREDLDNISRRYHHEMWELLHKVLLKVQGYPKSEEDIALVKTIVEQVEKFLDTCDAPARKTMLPLSHIMRIIRNREEYSVLVDWEKFRSTVEKFHQYFRSQKFNRNIAKDINRLRSLAPYDAETKKLKMLEKNEKKRKRKGEPQENDDNDTKKQKVEEKIVTEKKSDIEKTVDKIITKVPSAVSHQEINRQNLLLKKEVKAKINYEKKQRKKALRDKKRAARKLAEQEGVKYIPQTDPNNKTNDPEKIKKGQKTFQAKKERIEADKLLSAELQSGIFSGVIPSDVTPMEE